MLLLAFVLEQQGSNNGAREANGRMEWNVDDETRRMMGEQVDELVGRVWQVIPGRAIRNQDTNNTTQPVCAANVFKRAEQVM